MGDITVQHRHSLTTRHWFGLVHALLGPCCISEWVCRCCYCYFHCYYDLKLKRLSGKSKLGSSLLKKKFSKSSSTRPSFPQSSCGLALKPGTSLTQDLHGSEPTPVLIVSSGLTGTHLTPVLMTPQQTGKNKSL